MTVSVIDRQVSGQSDLSVVPCDFGRMPEIQWFVTRLVRYSCQRVPQSGSCRHPKFRKRAVEVIGDGALGQEKPGRDFLIPKAAGRECGDLIFPWREMRSDAL